MSVKAWADVEIPGEKADTVEATTLPKNNNKNGTAVSTNQTW
jgi:hypothetical protein